MSTDSPPFERMRNIYATRSGQFQLMLVAFAREWEMARISDRFEDIVLEAVERWDGHPPLKLDGPGADPGTVDIWRTDSSGKTTAIEVTSATDETHAANSALPDSLRSGVDQRLRQYWMLLAEGQRVDRRKLESGLVDVLLALETEGIGRDARGFGVDARLVALGFQSANPYPIPEGGHGEWNIGLVSGGVASSDNFSAVVQSALDRPDNARKLRASTLDGKSPDERWLWVFIGAGHFGQERNLHIGFTDGLPTVRLPDDVDAVVVTARSSGVALKYTDALGWELLDVGDPDVEHTMVERGPNSDGEVRA